MKYLLLLLLVACNNPQSTDIIAPDTVYVERREYRLTGTYKFENQSVTYRDSFFTWLRADTMYDKGVWWIDTAYGKGWVPDGSEFLYLSDFCGGQVKNITDTSYIWHDWGYWEEWVKQ